MDEIERARERMQEHDDLTMGGLQCICGMCEDTRPFLARIDELEARSEKAEAEKAELNAAIEWQRADNLTQLRIYVDERDTAKHALRAQIAELRGFVERMEAEAADCENAGDHVSCARLSARADELAALLGEETSDG